MKNKKKEEKNNIIKISTIVPVYNVEKYISRCLDSIIEQTYKNIEIILVDDGSTDSSGAICDEYAKKDKRIQVIHKENNGLVSARKAGVLLATGEYISYVDSDDWIEYDTYEKMIGVLEIYHPDIICFGFKKEYFGFTIERKELLDEGFYNKEKFLIEAGKCIKKNNFFCPIVHTTVWSKIYKAEMLKKYQLEVDDHIRIGEDMAVVFPCILNISNLYIMETCLYHYCVRKSSIIWNKEKDEFERYLKVVKLLTESWKKVPEDKKVSKDYLIYVIYYCLIICAPSYCFKKDRCILFPEIEEHDNILIYGKGVFSTSLINNLKYLGISNIMDCIDKNDIIRIKELSENTYKYIVIAITDYIAVHSTLLLLENLGIKNDKILYINKDYLKLEQLPKEVQNIISNII